MRPDENSPRLPMMLTNTFALRADCSLSKKAQFEWEARESYETILEIVRAREHY